MEAPAENLGIGRIPILNDGDFARFRGLILKQAGIHLSDHKRHLLVARLARRLHELSLSTFSNYYEYLTADASGAELRNFINRITTNKTSFFREPHHFEFLRERIIPEIRQAGRRELRIWSAGCSTGEEPYSIAIAVREALGTNNGWDVRILASDIDTEVLAKGEAGTYGVELLNEISPERRKANFLRGYGRFEGLVQVRPELRRMIEFRRINFNDHDWAVHGRFDLIFCRNVIIYFDRQLQERIVERLAAHLKPAGYFFSGHSENLYWLADLLTAVQATVYRLKHGGNDQ